MAEANGIRWHGTTFRPSPEDWQRDEGRNVLMVDCGKGMPPTIGNLIRVVDQRLTFTLSETWRVRDIQRIAQYRVVGLVVSEATTEEIEEADASLRAAMEAATIRDAVRTMERLSDRQRRQVLSRLPRDQAPETGIAFQLGWPTPAATMSKIHAILDRLTELGGLEAGELADEARTLASQIACQIDDGVPYGPKEA